MSQVETPRSPAALMLLLLCTQAFTAEIAAKRASSRGLHHERTKSEARQVQDHLVYILPLAVAAIATHPHNQITFVCS